MAQRGKVVAIIQARMASKRLPGKVLKGIAGEPMLVRVVERTRRARTLDETVVATSSGLTDDPIAALCRQRGYPCVRGEEADVLARYLQAARQYDAHVVVRITADCPLMDAELVDEVVAAFLAAEPPVDYASNRIVRRYPIGLDVEVMSRGALERAGREAHQPYQREHVTPYLYEEPGRFAVLSVEAPQDHGELRWTVDTEEDLRFVRQVYARFPGDPFFGWRQVLDLLRAEPQLAAINAHVRQKHFREAEE